MRILAIVGSPRAGGNTGALTVIALEEIRKEGLETELTGLAGKEIQTCDSCRSFWTIGKCHIKDYFEPIFNKMVKADGLILSTQIYYGAATPQLVSFIIKFLSYSKDKKPLENKVGGPIVVGRRAGQNSTLAQLMLVFMFHGMIVSGSTYWNIAFSREKGEVDKDDEGVRTIKKFACMLSWLAKKINA